MMFGFLKSRKFRRGSVATAVTVAVIALIVVFNMIVSIVSDRFSLNFDLTSNKLFAISSETKDYLAELSQDVSIYILSDEKDFASANQYFLQANEVIKKYAQFSPRITVSYVDIVRNPGFTANYPDLQLSSGSILVTSGNKVKDITPYELYNIETNYYTGSSSVISSKAEQVMTSAILQVTSSETYSVVSVSGHNETAIEGLTAQLELNNYTFKEQNIGTEDFDMEADVVVINAPGRDFTGDEIKKLDNFLNNSGQYGKTVMYFASAMQPDLPNLEAFLADWGIGVGSGIVLETDQSKVFSADDPFMAIVSYTEDVYAKTVLERRMYTTVPQSRPLSVLFEEKSNLTVTAPLMFSEQSCVYPLDADESWQPVYEGAIPALIVSQSVNYSGTTAMYSNVVACGSLYAIDTQFLSAGSLGNAEYFTGLFNALVKSENTVSIQAKELGSAELPISLFQFIIIAAAFLIFIMGFLIFGIVVWISRRHR